MVFFKDGLINYFAHKDKILAHLFEILSLANFSEDINLYNNITNTFFDSSFSNSENKNIL